MPGGLVLSLGFRICAFRRAGAYIRIFNVNVVSDFLVSYIDAPIVYMHRAQYW